MCRKNYKLQFMTLCLKKKHLRKTLEKKHPEYICSMRLGVMSSEINRFTRSVSSSEANEGIKEMQKEIVTLKETN